jgi:Zn-dependent M28 family amino/carboxypeptidase
MEQAATWALQKFRQYGLNASLEVIQVPHGWVRGKEFAELVKPVHRTIHIHAAGWSKATDGLVIGEVLPVVGKTADELRTYVGKVKGKIVLDGEPLRFSAARDENSFSALRAVDDGLGQLSDSEMEDRQQVLGQLSTEGPLVILMDSGKPRGLFNMGSFTQFEPTPAPMAFVTHDEYVAIFNMARRHSVTMRIRLDNGFTAGAVPASSVIAEIAGHSSERVIITGHLDSWDLGAGAVDNGVGAMAVLEAARAIQALKIKPARTLVFALFTGEEQGRLGARNFIRHHQDQLGNIDAVLALDGGTGRVISISFGGPETPPTSAVYQPLSEVFALDRADAAQHHGSDHDEFLAAKVPAYICIQAPARYAEAHHSQLDNLPIVDFAAANQAAALLAAWLWNTAEFPQRMPLNN